MARKLLEVGRAAGVLAVAPEIKRRNCRSDRDKSGIKKPKRIEARLEIRTPGEEGVTEFC